MMTSTLSRTAILVILLIGEIVLIQSALANGQFQQITGPCRLSFPVDHGAHPSFRTEWWYYTGNVSTHDNRRFGFQLTFFRRGLRHPDHRQEWPKPSSAWRTDQIYLAHAAITDIAGGRHLQAERMARPVLTLAGAKQTGGTTTIHLHTWKAVIAPDRHLLQADTDDFAIKLDLKPAKALVRHGRDGYSLKGLAPERASCYYSYTRLLTAGTLTVEGTPHNVEGTSWMDHEYSSAPLQAGIIGWDWFSLQLDDQTEVMIFLLRQTDGTLNAASSGTYVSPSGQAQHLKRADINITPIAFWSSPHSDARYPIKWQMAIHPIQLSLTISANLKDQEMLTTRSTNVIYWEGSVTAEGMHRDRQRRAVGYVELTGYANPFDALE